MKTLVTVLLTLLVAVPIATAAGKVRTYYLKRGDAAAVEGSDSLCTVVRLPKANGFRCKVGGDYRAKYGVTINSYEVTVTQYTAFDRFKVILKRRQSPLP